MKITIDIATGNAAFTDEYEDTTEANRLAKHEEVGRILREVAVAIFAGAEGGRCTDHNGNTVGLWSVEDNEAEPQSSRSATRFMRNAGL